MRIFYLYLTMVIRDQYHNHQEMLQHVMNLNPIHLFVVVMDHSQPKFIIKNKQDSRKRFRSRNQWRTQDIRTVIGRVSCIDNCLQQRERRCARQSFLRLRLQKTTFEFMRPRLDRNLLMKVSYLALSKLQIPSLCGNLTHRE